MTNLTLMIKKLIRKHYISTRLLYDYKTRRDGIGSQPIIIYQMGKVGSTSILHSLQATNLFPDIFQVHTLSAQGINKMEKRYWGNTPMLFRKSLLPETTHVFISHTLKSLLGRDSSVDWKIITLVRDPIARNVSEFFYSVDTTKSDPHLPNFYERYRSGDIKISELIDRFTERFSETSDEYAVPLNWFDREIQGVLGVDVYSSDFSKSRGYQAINANGYDILIIKLEKLKDCYLEAFQEFLGLKNFDLITTNTANQKDYSAAYNTFILEAKLPLQYLTRVYESRLVRHFYTEQEVEQFIRKWHKG